MTALLFGSSEASEVLAAKLPAHLRREHYSLERFANGLWRWRHVWPNGFAHVGVLQDTPALAAESAVRDYRWRVALKQIDSD